MPKFKVHQKLARKIGYVVGGFLAVIVFLDTQNLVATGLVFGLCFLSARVGGSAPDIDSYSSIPRRKFNQLAQFVAFALLSGAFVSVGTEVWSFTEDFVFIGLLSVFSTVFVAIGVRSVPRLIHSVMPTHRGIVHTATFWLASTSLAYILIQLGLSNIGATQFAITYLPLVLTIPFFVGAIGHIAQDRADSFFKQNPAVKEVSKWAPTRKPVILDLPQLGRILFNRKSPWTVRILGLGVILYGFLPFDIITDIIPIVGWTDDIGAYMFLRETVYRAAESGKGVIGSAVSVIESAIVMIVLLIISLVVVVAYVGWF